MYLWTVVSVSWCVGLVQSGPCHHHRTKDYRVPTLPGKWEKSGNSVYTFHGREKSLNFTEIVKIREKIGNFISSQGSFVVPNLFGY